VKALGPLINVLSINEQQLLESTTRSTKKKQY